MKIFIQLSVTIESLTKAYRKLVESLTKAGWKYSKSDLKTATSLVTEYIGLPHFYRTFEYFHPAFVKDFDQLTKAYRKLDENFHPAFVSYRKLVHVFRPAFVSYRKFRKLIESWSTYFDQLSISRGSFDEGPSSALAVGSPMPGRTPEMTTVNSYGRYFR